MSIPTRSSTSSIALEANHMYEHGRGIFSEICGGRTDLASLSALVLMSLSPAVNFL